MIQTISFKPTVQNDFSLHQAQLLINAAKEREIKKEKAIIEIRRALTANNFDWA